MRMGGMAVWGMVLGMVMWTWSGVEAQGFWETVVDNAGISTMHAAVTHYGNVVLLDRTNIGPSQLPLDGGRCRDNAQDRATPHDCTAHSALYSPGGNNIRPLMVQTDTWCSSGQFNADGVLIQTGGDADGNSKIRHFTPCGDGACDWVEQDDGLQNGRWYSTNQILPDGSIIVVGGRGTTTVEYVPANGRGTFDLPLLTKSNDDQMDNLYPFVHLLPTDQLFIFANRDSVLFDWKTNKQVRDYPTIPGEPRNYPSGGSSVMLPLSAAANYGNPEILVCGGAKYPAFTGGLKPASQSCGRIAPLSAAADWAMETMPQPRVMGDMILLPTRDVLIINGAATGAQGWGNAADPVTTPVLYKPNAGGDRFETLTGTDIARVYHSTANLLPDGRILLAGSNTHQFYTLAGYLPTELRIEAFSPPYLGNNRPAFAAAPGGLKYGEDFIATIKAAGAKNIELNLASAPYVTHTFAQGQRLLQLKTGAPVAAAGGAVTVASTAPTDAAVAPAGYYMLFPVADGNVGDATWIKIG